MKVEWNLVHAMCNAKISDRKALEKRQLKNKGYTMRFYQIGLLITLSLIVFGATIDAKSVFMVLAFLLILGLLFNKGMDYLTGSCLLWQDFSKADSRKNPILITILNAISPSITVGLAAVFFTPNVAQISKVILLVIFTIGCVASYAIFAILFSYYLSKN